MRIDQARRKQVERIWRKEGLKVPRKQMERGRPQRILAIIDESTRECLALHVARMAFCDYGNREAAILAER